MKFKKKYLIGFTLGIAFFITLIIAGCSSASDIASRSGAQLWGENCGHCHNIRPPQALTDAQWEVVGMHMRGRANLTAVEEQKIVEFLKSAN